MATKEKVSCEAISNFSGEGQTLADLEAQGECVMPRKPANESLVKTFKRCHDYILKWTRHIERLIVKSKPFPLWNKKSRIGTNKSTTL